MASGQFQITRNTYELIKDEFDCEPRDDRRQGGRRTEVWHVIGRKRARLTAVG